jgi:hypothetical protein
LTGRSASAEGGQAAAIEAAAWSSEEKKRAGASDRS